jgi:acyl carrier protein
MEPRVLATILGIAQRRDPALTAIRRDQALAALGFDSLDLAQLVAMLETETGLDPFATQTIGSVVTVGDLCDLYARAEQA